MYKLKKRIVEMMKNDGKSELSLSPAAINELRADPPAGP